MTPEESVKFVRLRAMTDYDCGCAWCCFRANQLLMDKPDPGRPTRAISDEMEHQGPAALELVR